MLRITLSPKNTTKVVKCACVLHNLCTGDNGDICEIPNTSQADPTTTFMPLRGRPLRPSAEAMYICDNFNDYFVQLASVEWQNQICDTFFWQKMDWLKRNIQA